MGTTSLSILFIIELIVIVFLTFLLSQKNDTIESQKEWMASLESCINDLERTKAKLQKEIQNGKEKLSTVENKFEEDRNEHTKTIEVLNETISELKKNKAESEKELAKARENYQSIVERNEESQKTVNSFKERNKDLESLICELKRQISQTQKDLKQIQSQMLNKHDNPFERMSIW